MSSTPFRALLSPLHHGLQLRVFVSSTFRDMERERDALVRQAFPSIRQQCRQHGLIFTDVDLRWGITERGGRRGRVVRTCLDEIGTRLPFIVAVIGEESGWCPSIEEIESDPLALRSYPWLLDASIDHRTLVEMETLGMLEHERELQGRIAFYTRTDVADIAARNDELGMFLRRVAVAGIPIREGYGDAATLARWVEEDLRALVDRLAPLRHNASYLERERHGHEAFARTRRRGYIESREMIELLDDYARFDIDDPPLPLVVTGPSGAGKSALLAYWLERYHERFPTAFVISHHVGATSSSTDHHALLRRVMLEIKERCALDDEVPTTPALIESEFALWLARAPRDGLLLVIDAIDQLPASAGHMRWLPRFIPPNCRLVLSTLHGSTLDALGERSWRSVEVEPLDRPTREGAIRSYLQDYGKELDAKQIRRISGWPATSSPLFLRTSLEELRIAATFENLNQRIDYYLEAIDNDDLFQRVLARVEEDLGTDLVAGALPLIWGTRDGISDEELVALTRRHRSSIARLLVGLEHHLMRRNERLTFFHDHLRAAVERRYLPRASDRKQVHRRLARYFARRFDELVGAERAETSAASNADRITSITSIERIASELPYHLQHAHAWTELRQRLLDIRIADTLISADRSLELWNYWRISGDSASAADGYVDAAERWTASRSVALDDADRIVRIGSFLTEVGMPEHGEKVLRIGIDVRSQVANDDGAGALEGIQRLVESLVAQGRYDNAQPLCQRVVDGYSTMRGERDPATLWAMGTMASILLRRGEIDQAIELGSRRLLLNEIERGADSSGVADSLRDLATAYQERGDYGKAKALLTQSLRIWERLLGYEHPVTALGYAELATIHYRLGEHDKSEELLLRAIGLREKILGPSHPDTIRAYQNLGTVYRITGQYVRAEALYRKTLEVPEAIGLPDRAIITHNLGVLLSKQGRGEEAEPLLHRSMEMFERVFGTRHVNTASAINSLGDLLLTRRRYAEAERLYCRALDIYRAGYPSPHPAIAGTYARLADIHASRSEFEAAERDLRVALRMFEECSGTSHVDTARCQSDLARILLKRGLLHEASRTVTLAISSFKAALGEDHASTVATVELAKEIRNALEETNL